jgi:hypothetical protein
MHEIPSPEIYVGAAPFRWCSTLYVVQHPRRAGGRAGGRAGWRPERLMPEQLTLLRRTKIDTEALSCIHPLLMYSSYRVCKAFMCVVYQL